LRIVIEHGMTKEEAKELVEPFVQSIMLAIDDAIPEEAEMAQSSTRQFPIQRSNGYPVGFVPWAVAEQAYEQYVRLGHGEQSLERLAERGGFGWSELTLLLRGRNPWGRDR